MSADTIIPGADALTIGESTPGQGPVNPQALNRYSYVNNNPLKSTDPTGHFAWVVGAALIGAAINVATTTAISYAVEGRPPSVGEVAGAAISGAIGGALTSVGGPLVATAASKLAPVVGAAIAQPLASVAVNVVGNIGAEFVGGTVGAVIDNAASNPSPTGPSTASLAGAAASGTSGYATSPLCIPLEGNMSTFADVRSTMAVPATPAKWTGPVGEAAYNSHLAVRGYNAKSILINTGISMLGGAIASAVTNQVVKRHTSQ